ncbi:ATPase [Methanobrevibacter sp.]|jgi:hypothetical protein|uniref:ATPase n=1 Tax=Methanobrevibacter sp. TaxID=66852 RepID=UPI0025FE10C0|nr:ATPase [Methanobrevibacter sp.]
MNGTTIILWATIFIIGAIAIILVKLHYRGAELEKEEESILPTEAIGNFLSNQRKTEPEKPSLNPQTQQNNNFLNKSSPIVEEDAGIYLAPEVEEDNYKNLEYESQNQVLINYENKIKKNQDPMNEYQVEIMSQDNEKHELKDLFTIDELIKESKRKDSEREKEAQQIHKDDDEELNELKESIRRRKENEEIEDKLIEEILADEEIEKILSGEDKVPEETTTSTEKPKEETIEDIITKEEKENVTTTEKPKEETIEDIITKEEKETPEDTVQEVLEVETIEDVLTEKEPDETVSETPSVASQKDIEEAISSASQEVEEKEIEEISESDNITDVLLNSEDNVQEEIKEPALKSPTKISEKSDDFGAPIDDSNLFEPEETNELDYRNDLNKIKNTIKGSKIFQDVKERLRPEPEYSPINDLEENYIRNVNEYEDEYAPIINETHDEFGEYYEPNYDEAIREQNTRKLFEKSEVKKVEPVLNTIKPKPSRENIKIHLNNSEVVLKKGDEIIFKHDGETYSSQVYAINGDDISVRYRRKDIKIKPADVKKIY